MAKKYTFIHPTKSGGTAFQTFYLKHYINYFQGTGHDNLCKPDNNPIILVRDVYTRFYSMFKYWKAGAEGRPRPPNFVAQHRNDTILDFIDMLKTNNKELIYGFTWDKHFTNTNYWINNTDYKHIVVFRYNNDLNSKLPKLLAELGIPDKNITMPHVNVSTHNKKDEEFYKENEKYVNEFIREYFKKDIELIDAIENTPELFKLVV